MPLNPMNPKTHWDTVYTSKRPDEVSWFQREPTVSLELIRKAAPSLAAAIIDVGGGASVLVDRLLGAGYRDVTVLDVSQAALDVARERLASAAASVTWLDADILTAALPQAAFDVWHDRALFHFLTDADDRARYIRQARQSLKPGGSIVIATFAHDGPTKCSGLPVVRYTTDGLQQEFGAAFRLVETVREEHVTPSGSTQAFVYCVLR